MIKDKLEQLARQLNLIDPNEEPEKYILTPEDEENIIESHIKSEKEIFRWRRMQLGEPLETVEFKISEIDWQEGIDWELIFKEYNSARHYSIWEKEQRKKEIDEEQRKKEELVKRCTANYVFNVMKWTSKNVYEKDLLVNDDTTYLIKVLCFFLSNDPRFETELKFSFSKGLWIRGISGLGKTHLVKCVEKNELYPILILSMLDIQEEIKNSGEYQIFSTEYKRKIFLDDVGTEEAVINHFGTKISWFKDFIELYYMGKKNFDKLIVTTNNSFKEIEGKYGFRVKSRLTEMFNVVDVKGKDLRK